MKHDHHPGRLERMARLNMACTTLDLHRPRREWWPALLIGAAFGMLVGQTMRWLLS